MNPNLLATLRERGHFEAVTDPAFEEISQKESFTVYAGFDPTAPSMHIGNLVVVMGLKRFQAAGHRPIALAGGGTGMIGDPSGKRAERTMMSRETTEANTAAIAKQLAKFLDFDGPNGASVVNNADWLAPLSFIEFLRDSGKYFRISDMLEKDSVKARLESETGISFTEFCYMLLQAYDFAYLYEHRQCRVQIGGADQWGNITAGTDLIRKSLGGKAYGLTFPLLLTATGQKFGKSEAGAVWLDPEMTSPYAFYQYWMASDDRDIEKYLKLFTMLPLDEIAAIVAEHAAAPEKRSGQRRLAQEITLIVHGAEETRKAEEASQALFSSKGLDAANANLAELFPEAPTVELDAALLDGEGLSIMALLSNAGLAASKGEAKRLVQQGGAYLNQERIDDGNAVVTRDGLSRDGALLLRTGKKNFRLVKFKTG
jgi:tyrosyl-tRNA synthetase